MSILWIQEHETSFHFLLSPSNSSFNALDFSLQQSCSLCQDCVCVRASLIFLFSQHVSY